MIAAQVTGLTLRYGKVIALDGVDLAVRAGIVTGLIGPDGVGKSSLLAVIAGARRIQQGRVEVLGGDMAQAGFRRRACPRIAYMPQGLGRNLYPTLSIEENLQSFARLFGHAAPERRRRIDALTGSLGLSAFLDRPAGQLSGGMRQKLGLCCALIHDPDLLILDEPTTGVDPLARVQFWELIAAVRQVRPALTVLVATTYMDEASRFDALVAIDGGRILATGTPRELLERTGSATLEQAFLRLLPPDRMAPQPTAVPHQVNRFADEIVIEAAGLSRRFGTFVAVADVSFQIRRGEIFGFIGSNGCGKTTTMKMLAGPLAPSGGGVRLFGQDTGVHAMAARRRVGYMSQGFALYQELTVQQNLLIHARLFALDEDAAHLRCAAMAERFGLRGLLGTLPARLPLGMRQRLSLAVALVHAPDLLILDEPTSGVDPVARDQFWEFMLTLAHRDGVTIFISTHFMNEAERCDRVALMHEGRVLATGAPDALQRERGAASLEQAFIGWLKEAGQQAGSTTLDAALLQPGAPARGTWRRRVLATTWREALELRRDPVRATLLLMIVIAFGISLDVEDLRYAVLDRDQSALSRDYALNLSGSRYFVERQPLSDYDALDQRMRAGELALALEIPPGFARDVAHRRPVAIGAWIDGANPVRAETVLGYLQGVHQAWLEARDLRTGVPAPAGAAVIAIRFRYNPDVRSLPAMVPGVLTLLLLMFPAMLAALSVVREKEMGSIVNLYVTPLRRSEFLIGKQVPYVVLAMGNFVLMSLLAVTLFRVPVNGSIAALAVAALLFCICSTGIGLLASTFTRSQIAAIFFTMIGTMIPAIQYAGLINPVAALQGAARVVGEAYPASHMLTIARGVFGKALGFADLGREFGALLLAAPVIAGLAIAFLPKQER